MRTSLVLGPCLAAVKAQPGRDIFFLQKRAPASSDEFRRRRLKQSGTRPRFMAEVGFGSMKKTDLTYPDGGSYTGQVKDNIPHGLGSRALPDGSYYKGEIQNGYFHGLGMLTFADDSKYEGEFFEGKFGGSGVFTSADGLTFHGEFRDGTINGKGLFTFKDGTHGVKRQEGTFINGKLKKPEVCQSAVQRASEKAEKARSTAQNL